MKRPLQNPGTKQQGAVLIIVLWIIMLLTFLLAAHTNNVKTETRIVKDLVGQIRLRAAAEGVVNYLSMVHVNSPQGLTEKSGQTLELDIGGQGILYRVIPETSFVSINVASAEILEVLLSAVAQEGEDTASLAAAIVDWRDPDNITLPNGAEGEEYESLGFSYLPRDGPFQSLEELARVRGMSRSLLEKLEPYVSEFSINPVVDLQYAPEKLVEILDGTHTGGEDEEQPVMNGAVGLGPTFSNYQLDGIASAEIYRVQVEFAGNNQMRQQMEITVSFGAGTSGLPYTIKKWNEYTAHFKLAED